MPLLDDTLMHFANTEHIEHILHTATQRKITISEIHQNLKHQVVKNTQKKASLNTGGRKLKSTVTITYIFMLVYFSLCTLGKKNLLGKKNNLADMHTHRGSQKL